MSPPDPEYRGRFAPTPSGPLHLGSLLTALTSWLRARQAGGRWLLRIDDLDRARCPPGASAVILRQLEAHGLHWDETPRLQSAHGAEYTAALERLQSQGRVYPCDCTRARLAAESRPGPDGPVYSGRCRSAPIGTGAAALRWRVPSGGVELQDPVQGRLWRDAESEIGDFVLRRGDGVCGYQLACVVDEQAQGITEVVRGADLIGSSLRQILLLGALGAPVPAYLHLPVLVAVDGRKLSKQNGAPALDEHSAGANLQRCLRALGGAPPVELERAAPQEILAWALREWRLTQVAPARQQSIPEMAG
ncbi:tRNA glutamyl-Q(34) synthetase GluQRS [Stagnimonas aquatica]|uniref:Glutamyl-Q tRNA(Asp) synthetase n=1 Tax=Stagnimonas aquatica TaxID=2689987 RepID=A0A3N0VE08_9GAMM|nr:tRNA glutamyl-Q(34) synthetase GluQRS [Stagnimonas aquatica]ROH90905.1 tRNA glutamyl-Q(34) synthetase GluQRS [Stagnimonas aquatica]